MCQRVDCVQYHEFMSGWRNQSDNITRFVLDGPITCHYWHQKKRIVFVLKESYGMFGQDPLLGYEWRTIPNWVLDPFKDASSKKLISKVNKASYMIHNQNLGIPLIVPANIINSVAWINIKKIDDGHIYSNDPDIIHAYQDHVNRLHEQINSLNPTHVILAIGNIAVNGEPFFHDLNQNIHVIRTNHPAAGLGFNLYLEIVRFNSKQQR